MLQLNVDFSNINIAFNCLPSVLNTDVKYFNEKSALHNQVFGAQSKLKELKRSTLHYHQSNDDKKLQYLTAEIIYLI